MISTFSSKKFNPVSDIRKAERHNPDNLLYLLDTIIHFMMAQESFDILQKSERYYRQELKKLTRSLADDINPIVSKDYTTVYRNGDVQTQNIISEFEILVRYLAIGSVPEKEKTQDLVKAYNQNKKLVGSIAKRVVRSDSRELKTISKEEMEYLSILDYTVNLVFIEKYLNKLKECHYNKTLLLLKIAKILFVLGPILKRDYHIVFKTTPPFNLIDFYRDWMDFLGSTKVDQKIVISQLIEAWNVDKKAVEGTINITLKKNA